MQRQSIKLKTLLVYLWFPLYAGLIGCTLNNTLPYKGDESYYISSSIHMVQSGNFLVPIYFGDVRFQKPLLPYWLTSAGYKIFGISLWSGRLTFLLLACGLLILLYKFALLIVPNHNFALLNAFLLSSATLFIEYTRISMTDMPLTFFTTLALYYFYKAFQNYEYLDRYYSVAYIAAGFACLSKGFIGMFPCLAVALYLIWARPRQYRKYFLRLFHPLHLLLLFLFIFSWHLYAYLYYYDDLARQFAVESSDTFASNLWTVPGNALFYLRVLVTYYLPFTPLAIYLFFKHRTKIPDQLRPILFYIGFTLCFFIIFISRHKARYLLVIFPAVTLVISYIIYHSRFKKRAKAIAVIVASLQIAMFLSYPVISGKPLKELIQYWEVSLQGDLAPYELSQRDISWIQPLSHGKVQTSSERSDYLLIEAEKLDNFATAEVLRKSSRLSKIRLRNGKLIKQDRNYLLIRP